MGLNGYLLLAMQPEAVVVMSKTRWHVLRSEFSPATGLRQVNVTREPVRDSRRYEALSSALGDTYDHMERGGTWVWWYDQRPHDCHAWQCDRPEDHVYALFFDDHSRITTLRLVEA